MATPDAAAYQVVPVGTWTHEVKWGVWRTYVAMHRERHRHLPRGYRARRRTAQPHECQRAAGCAFFHRPALSRYAYICVRSGRLHMCDDEFCDARQLVHNALSNIVAADVAEALQCRLTGLKLKLDFDDSDVSGLPTRLGTTRRTEPAGPAPPRAPPLRDHGSIGGREGHWNDLLKQLLSPTSRGQLSAATVATWWEEIETCWELIQASPRWQPKLMARYTDTMHALVCLYFMAKGFDYVLGGRRLLTGSPWLRTHLRPRTQQTICPPRVLSRAEEILRGCLRHVPDTLLAQVLVPA